MIKGTTEYNNNVTECRARSAQSKPAPCASKQRPFRANARCNSSRLCSTHTSGCPDELTKTAKRALLCTGRCECSVPSQGGIRAPCAIQSLGVCVVCTLETRPGERKQLPQNKSRAEAAICVASPPPPQSLLLPSILPRPESRQRACAAAEQIRRRAFREVVGGGTPERPNPTSRPGLSTSRRPLGRGSFSAQTSLDRYNETA